MKHSFPLRSLSTSSLTSAHAHIPKRSYLSTTNKKDKLLLKNLLAMKRRKEKITMITCYDCNQAELADASSIDTILVGDSVANVMLGLNNTNAIDMNAMIHHTSAVSRGTNRAYLIGDMPFGSYLTTDDAVRNAARLIGEGGASCVKLEGFVPDCIREISRFVPVCAHLGLLPQTHDCFGSRGRTYRDIKNLCEESLKLQDSGASFLVLEKVCAETACMISEILEIPTIGIGSGPHCDGQVLVWHDVLGLSLEQELTYKFVKKYCNLAPSIMNAISLYISDVKSNSFPTPQHSYYLNETTRNKLKNDTDLWDNLLGISSNEFFDRIKEGHEYISIKQDDLESDPLKIERFRQLLPSQKNDKFTKIVQSSQEIRDLRNDLSSDAKDHRKQLIFIPFLGGLHDGHLDLIKHAKKYEATHQIWCSLFLNPLQFNDWNDYANYPYNMDSDILKLTQLGVDVIFTPNVHDFYPNYSKETHRIENEFGAFVNFENIENAEMCLEGAQRPGHFKGVGTVLTKLFSWIRPNKSIYGQKDFIQCIVVENLVNDFFPDIDVIIHDTVRELDGLAMSTRNEKLDKLERQRAPLIYQCLCVIGTHLYNEMHSKTKSSGGDSSLSVERCKEIGFKFANDNNVNLEYISIHNARNGWVLNDDNKSGDLETVLKSNNVVISIAGSVGSSTRLIDNIVIGKDKWDSFKHTNFADLLK